MFYELKLKNGESYNLRMKSKTVIEFEKENGSVFEYLSKGTVESLVVLLFYLIRDYNHGFTKDNAYDLYDKLIEDGYVFSTISDEIIAGGLQASGFFTKEDLEEMKQQMKK